MRRNLRAGLAESGEVVEIEDIPRLHLCAQCQRMDFLKVGRPGGVVVEHKWHHAMLRKNVRGWRFDAARLEFLVHPA